MGSIIRSEMLRWRQTRGTMLVGIIVLAVSLAQGIWTFSQTNPNPGLWGPNAYLAFLSAVGNGPKSVWPVFLALGAALMGADSLAWDRRTGFGRWTISRTTRGRYVRAKWLAPVAMTGITVAGLLVIALCAALVLFPDGPARVSGPFPPFAHELFFTHPIWYCAILIGLITLTAMSWTSVAVWVGAVIPNLYLVVTLPWFLSFLLSFLLPHLGWTLYAPFVLAGTFPTRLSPPGYGWSIVVLWCSWLALSYAVLSLWYRRRDVLE